MLHNRRGGPKGCRPALRLHLLGGFAKRSRLPHSIQKTQPITEQPGNNQPVKAGSPAGQAQRAGAPIRVPIPPWFNALPFCGGCGEGGFKGGRGRRGAEGNPPIFRFLPVNLALTKKPLKLLKVRGAFGKVRQCGNKLQVKPYPALCRFPVGPFNSPSAT